MAQNPPRTYAWSGTAPKLSQLTNAVLFDDVWERPELSKRDRSLITVATLIATYRPLAMPFHFKFALENGVTREELVEVVTHLALYAGWPSATPAAEILGSVFDELDR
jgi:4-carboxymuconolactone decarboxylase